VYSRMRLLLTLTTGTVGLLITLQYHLLIYRLYEKMSGTYTDEKLIGTDQSDPKTSTDHENLLMSTEYNGPFTIPPGSPSLLITHCNGRLGNQMSAFASVYAMSKLYGYRCVTQKFQADFLRFFFSSKSLDTDLKVLEEDYKEFFGDVEIADVGNIKKRVKWRGGGGIHEALESKIDYNTSERDPAYLKGHAIIIGAYVNQLKYIVKVLPDIKRMFQLKPKYTQIAYKRMVSIVGEKNNWDNGQQIVAVHVRRGDYARALSKYGLTNVNGSYFSAAMDYYRAKWKSVKFIVGSNDLDWAKENLAGEDVFFLDKSHVSIKEETDLMTEKEIVGVDLAVLTSCNHTIMSFGTFGIWISLLAGGEVVFPSTLLITKEGKEMTSAGLQKSWKVIKVD